MRELPILFSAPMVRAILEGRKTNRQQPLQQLTSFTGGAGSIAARTNPEEGHFP